MPERPGVCPVDLAGVVTSDQAPIVCGGAGRRVNAQNVVVGALRCAPDVGGVRVC
jgi:hypothetical protein